MQSNGPDDSAPCAEPNAAPDGRTIYIRAVVDVAGTLRDLPALPVASETPLPVSFDSGRLIVTAMPGSADQDTGAISVNAATGDTLRFYAVSGSNNFDAAVLIQDVIVDDSIAADDTIFSELALVNLQQQAVAPATPAGELAVTDLNQEFWFWQCAVAGEGSQNFSLVLALYGRDEDGQPRHAGLYRWDLNLTVQTTSRSTDDNT
jgi:hypothetical protein